MLGPHTLPCSVYWLHTVFLVEETERVPTHLHSTRVSASKRGAEGAGGDIVHSVCIHTLKDRQAARRLAWLLLHWHPAGWTYITKYSKHSLCSCWPAGYLGHAQKCFFKLKPAWAFRHCTSIQTLHTFSDTEYTLEQCKNVQTMQGIFNQCPDIQSFTKHEQSDTEWRVRHRTKSHLLIKHSGIVRTFRHFMNIHSIKEQTAFEQFSNKARSFRQNTNIQA